MSVPSQGLLEKGIQELETSTFKCQTATTNIIVDAETCSYALETLFELNANIKLCFTLKITRFTTRFRE